MVKRDSGPQASNEGIQATNVSAGVLAVGQNARASGRVNYGSGGGNVVEEHVSHLEQALAGLIQDRHQLRALGEEIAVLRESMAAPTPKPEARPALERLVAKLKMTHVAVKEVASLVTPLTAIANALSVPLHLLGL